MKQTKRFAVVAGLVSAALLAGGIGLAGREAAEGAGAGKKVETSGFLPEPEEFPAELAERREPGKEEAGKLETMKVIAENDALILYFDEKETGIAVEKKSTGQVWFSNPVGAEEDPVASPYARQRLKAQFTVHYYNESVQAAEMDNYNDSITEGQFEVAYESQGVTVTYTLGNTGRKLILPQVISEERFLSYLERMDAKAVKQVKRNYTLLSLETMKESEKDASLDTYPSLAEHNIYILKNGTKEYKQEELSGYFAEAGYTAEDMASDMEANGYVAEVNDPYFIIPLHYCLDGENLIASVRPEEIEYNTDGYYLTEIDLLECFGAGSTKDEGYLFVPDGSGALIYYNNGKNMRQAYTGQVYGADWSVNFLSDKKPEYDDKLSVKLPIFGAVTGEQAFLAILEDGEALASINADISGRVNSYNTVCAGFTYLQNGPISLGDIIGNNSFQMYGRRPYEGEFRIRYAFLSGSEANYSGMANYYRKYLVGQGILKRREVAETMPFYLEYIGAIDKSKSVLGVKYNTSVALTTFAQAEEISGELTEAGITNQKLRFTGWMNGGLANSAPAKISPVQAVEKGMDTEEFASVMKQAGIPVYFDTEFQRVYRDRLFDGYASGSEGPRYFDKTVVETGDYLIPNGLIREKDIDLISPYSLGNIIDRYLKAAPDYGLTGCSVGGLACTVYSDFMDSEIRYTDRQQAAKLNGAALKRLAEAYPNRLMGENAAQYAFSAVSDIVQAPMDSNNFQILDETVPFYEMVLRSYVEYAGNPINLSEDAEWTLLKSIETGAGLYYQWCYADNSLVKETEYSYLYSVNYQYWMEEAVSQYRKLNEIFGKLQGQSILRHEKLAEGVYLVTYEKGTQIGVNYQETDYKQGDTRINGRNFSVVKEGE